QLKRFRDGDDGAMAAARLYLERLRGVRRETVEKYADRWREAVEAIADRAANPRYNGLKLTPIPGLIPVGQDPDSKLFEFAHYLTGAVPERDAAGRLLIMKDSA